MIEKFTNVILWFKWELNLRLNVELKKQEEFKPCRGLEIHSNWFDICGDYNVIISHFPIFFMILANRFSVSYNHCTAEEYIKSLKNNKFYE